MKETLHGTEHPPLNFAMQPNLGGTNIPFVREVTRYRDTYIVSNDFSKTFLTVPFDKDVIHVAVENLNGKRFLETYYDRAGNLTSANLWFRAYCDQEDFAEKTNPSQTIIDTYDKLIQGETDLMFEVDLSRQSISLCFCEDNSRSDNVKIIADSERELLPGIDTMTFCFENAVENEFITFCEKREDNILSLGLVLQDGTFIYETVSMVVDPSRIIGPTTPKDVDYFIGSIFVQF